MQTCDITIEHSKVQHFKTLSICQ